jgi:hypothetical protein
LLYALYSTVKKTIANKEAAVSEKAYPTEEELVKTKRTEVDRTVNTVLNQDSDNPDSFIGKQSHSPNSELELAIEQEAEERDQEGGKERASNAGDDARMSRDRKAFLAIIPWKH